MSVQVSLSLQYVLAALDDEVIWNWFTLYWVCNTLTIGLENSDSEDFLCAFTGPTLFKIVRLRQVDMMTHSLSNFISTFVYLTGLHFCSAFLITSIHFFTCAFWRTKVGGSHWPHNAKNSSLRIWTTSHSFQMMHQCMKIVLSRVLDSEYGIIRNRFENRYEGNMSPLLRTRDSFWRWKSSGNLVNFLYCRLNATPLMHLKTL